LELRTLVGSPYHTYQAAKQGFAWDSVVYGAESLGYASALHQGLAQQLGEQQIALYSPL